MKVVFLALVGCLMVGCSTAHYFEPPRANPAAALAAPNQYGQMVSLREATSGPWAVVFFYPEADTPG